MTALGNYIDHPTEEEKGRWAQLFNALMGIPDGDPAEFRELREHMAHMAREDRIAEAMSRVDLGGEDVTPAEMAEITKRLGGTSPTARLVGVRGCTIRNWIRGRFNINQSQAKALRLLAQEPSRLPQAPRRVKMAPGPRPRRRR